MVLAENLVILRNVKGMTQEQVAEVIGNFQTVLRKMGIREFPIVERHHTKYVNPRLYTTS